MRKVQLKFKDIGFGKNAYIADLKILFNSKQGKLSYGYPSIPKFCQRTYISRLSFFSKLADNPYLGVLWGDKSRGAKFSI